MPQWWKNANHKQEDASTLPEPNVHSPSGSSLSMHGLISSIHNLNVGDNATFTSASAAYITDNRKTIQINSITTPISSDSPKDERQCTPTPETDVHPSSGSLPSMRKLISSISSTQNLNIGDNATVFTGASPVYITDNRKTINKITNIATNGSNSLKGKELLEKKVALSALHDSAARFNPPMCDEDTRVELIDEMMDWVQNGTQVLLCMTGKAGTGKSALLQTISDRCAEQGFLAASFFFGANDKSRNHSSLLISTLAYQIAQLNDHLGMLIWQAVDKDPLIFKKSLKVQARALLQEPLQTFYHHHSSTSTPQGATSLPHVIVIDGLDECKGSEQQSAILHLLNLYFIEIKLPFKIIISSRPERAVQKALSTTRGGHLTGASVYHLELSEHDATADIRRYLTRRLSAAGAKSSDPRAQDESWPAENDVEELVKNADGHFVYAATVVKFVSQPYRSPFLQLQDVLTDHFQRENPFATLDALYTRIINKAQGAYKGMTDDPLVIARLLYKVDLLAERAIMTSSDYELIFDLEESTLSDDMLSDISSLIKIDRPDRGKISLNMSHKALSDFLYDCRRCGNLFISPIETLAQLLATYLNLAVSAKEPDIEELFSPDRSTNSTESCSAVEYSVRWWPLQLFRLLFVLLDHRMDVKTFLDSQYYPLLSAFSETYWFTATPKTQDSPFVLKTIGQWKDYLSAFILSVRYCGIKDMDNWESLINHIGIQAGIDMFTEIETKEREGWLVQWLPWLEDVLNSYVENWE